MTPQNDDWKKQALVDLGELWDIIEELRGIANRIDDALDVDNREQYEQAVSDWVGPEGKL